MVTTTTGIATEFITFSRASNATVTDSDGKIKWAPHNLLLASEQFDASSSWGLSGLLAFGSGSSANATASPNGTITAEYLRETNTTARHFAYAIASTTAGSNYTARVFVKAGERSFVALGIRTTDGVTGYAAAFNISTGAITATSSTGTPTNVSAPTPVSIGNGWYLISVSMDATTSQAYTEIGLSDSGTPTFAAGMPTYAGTGTSGLYLWGAALYRSDLGGMQANTSAYPMYNPTTPKNLLGYSDQFSTSYWNKVQITIAANTALAPNGLQTADKLVPTSGTSGGQIYNTTVAIISGGIYTASAYVKAGELGFAFVALNARASSTTQGVCVNLSTGAVSNQGASATYTVTSVGDGWWRVSCTGTANFTSGYLEVWPLASAGLPNSYTGDGTSGIYLWGAQLSDSASLDPYVPNYLAAPSAAAYYGPRLDYDPSTLACKGLLVEEQRTNLFQRTAEFDNAYWDKLNANVTNTTAVTAPDGTQTADALETTNASSCIVYKTVGSAAVHTVSVYAKAASASSGFLELYFAYSPQTHARFNLQTGAIVSTGGFNYLSSTITPVGDGWYRCSLTATLIGAALTGIMQTGHAGAGEIIYIWGAQIEAGSFATSYIPNGSAVAGATRAADVASVSTQAFPYNQPEGSLVVNFTPANTIANNTRITELSGGGSARVIDLYSNGTSWVIYNGTNSFTAGTPVLGAVTKIAAAYKTGNYGMSVNGGAVTADASSLVNTATAIYIGGNSVPSSLINGYIRQITYIPRRLSNTELQSRTQ